MKTKQNYSNSDSSAAKVQEALAALETALNVFGFDDRGFAEGIRNFHPTLQQSFFRVMRYCALYMAENNYHIDDRNRASYEMCREIAPILKKHKLPMV